MHLRGFNCKASEYRMHITLIDLTYTIGHQIVLDKVDR